MIDDPELRSIFKIEFEENIQTLNNELLKLESDVFNTDALTKLMRTAHSMKGGARMIGLPDVVTLAHFFEDMLGAVKKEGVELKRHDFDRMYKA
ncbi:MAG: Hpt domain-containing protein, partial [Ignavibacteriaceae bacterium]|nr:Hpt domain-containing protein [Ignavibacteriaceae bacterium]